MHKHIFCSCEVFHFLGGFIRFFIISCKSTEAVKPCKTGAVDQLLNLLNDFLGFKCLHIRNNRYICIYEID